MTINELEEKIESFKIANVDKNDLLELIYVLRAWELLSHTKEINDKNLTYYAFFKDKIKISRLVEIFNKLSKEIKLFRLYKLDVDKFSDEELAEIVDEIQSETPQEPIDSIPMDIVPQELVIDDEAAKTAAKLEAKRAQDQSAYGVKIY